MITQMVSGAHTRFQICVDSCLNRVVQGRIYRPYHSGGTFESLLELIRKIETQLNEQKLPQAYTEARQFLPVWQDPEHRPVPAQPLKGRVATFQIQIYFRQHSSWQGTILWKEHHTVQSFRSVLEMILLMDSALQEQESRNLA